MSTTFMIIDADPASAAVTAALLMRLAPDATICCVATPEHAWYVVQEHQPDALVIDPTPFRALGWLLIKLCREQYPEVLIGALASRLTESDAARLRALEVDLRLEKPSSPEQLRAALRGFVRTVAQRKSFQRAV